MNIAQVEYCTVLQQLFQSKNEDYHPMLKLLFKFFVTKELDIEFFINSRAIFIKFTCYFHQVHVIFSSSSRAIFSNGFYLAAMIILLNDFTLTFLKRLIGIGVHPTQ